MQIGEKIRKVRELKGLKQETVASKLGMSVTAYGNIERNESSLTYEKLEEIAAAMEVNVQDIISIPEQFNIQNITHSQVGYNYGTLASSDVEGYKAALEELKAQNEHLRAQVEKLTDALVAKK
jgi:transcriptional regulator with XRE-family HTH domain